MNNSDLPASGRADGRAGSTGRDLQGTGGMLLMLLQVVRNQNQGGRVMMDGVHRIAHLGRRRGQSMPYSIPPCSWRIKSH